METIALSAPEVTPTPAPKVHKSSTTKRKLRLLKVIPATSEDSVLDITVEDETGVINVNIVDSLTIEASSITPIPGPRMETLSGH